MAAEERGILESSSGHAAGLGNTSTEVVPPVSISGPPPHAARMEGTCNFQWMNRSTTLLVWAEILAGGTHGSGGERWSC